MHSYARRILSAHSPRFHLYNVKFFNLLEVSEKQWKIPIHYISIHHKYSHVEKHHYLYRKLVIFSKRSNDFYIDQQNFPPSVLLDNIVPLFIISLFMKLFHFSLLSCSFSIVYYHYSKYQQKFQI